MKKEVPWSHAIKGSSHSIIFNSLRGSLPTPSLKQTPVNLHPAGHCVNSCSQVGGKVAVSKTVSTIKDFRGSGLFLGSHFSGGAAIGPSTFSGGNNSQGGMKCPTGTSQGVGRHRKDHGGLTGSTVTIESSAGKRSNADKGERCECIGRVSDSASISDSGPTFAFVPALARENIGSGGGGGDVETSMVLGGMVSVEKGEPRRGRGANAGPLNHGDGFFGAIDEALNEGQGTRERGSGNGKRQEKTETSDKSAATRIADVLGRLPLSKLKIVIGAWILPKTAVLSWLNPHRI